MSATRRIKGVLSLATDAVEHGSRAIEKVHRATADRPFGALTKLPAPLAVPARGVKLVHDVSLTAVYGSIRIVNQGVAAMVDAGLDLVDAMSGAAPPEPPEEPAPGSGLGAPKERPEKRPRHAP